MEPIDSLISNVQNLEKIYDRWSIASNILILTVIILGAFLAWVQYRTSSCSEKVNKAKDELILARDKEQTLKISTLETEALKSKEEIAKAQAQAAEAKLELEKFKAPRTLTIEQQTRIANKLKQFSGISFDLTTYPNDNEPSALSKQIIEALVSSGWLFKPPQKSFLLESATGIVVAVNPDASPELFEARDKTIEALTFEGLKVTSGTKTLRQGIEIIIQVAKKP